MGARLIAAYEYDCDYCGQPFREPEFDAVFYVRALEDGQPHDLHDFELPDVTRLDDGSADLFVHDLGDCWHWCQDDDAKAIGPEATCPKRDTHSEQPVDSTGSPDKEREDRTPAPRLVPPA